jgi:GT2 family glycosyltransferase
MLNFALENNFDYFLMLNPDVLLEDNFLLELINQAKNYPDFSVLAPRILYWDFPNNKKTEIIDSCGVGITRSNFFFDRGQGKKFQEENYPAGEVFGFTGAGALLNLKNVSLITDRKNNYLEFFDEMMFMYKEDVEFSYRLQLAGLKVFFTPQAIMYHHRSLSSRRSKVLSLILKTRDHKSRSRSLQNQLIIMYKTRKLPFSARVRFSTAGRLFLLFIYSLFFRRRALINFMKIRGQIEAKPPYLKGNIDGALRVENFMDRA